MEFAISDLNYIYSNEDWGWTLSWWCYFSCWSMAFGFIWFKSGVCLWTHMPGGSNNLSICGNNCRLNGSPLSLHPYAESSFGPFLLCLCLTIQPPLPVQWSIWRGRRRNLSCSLYEWMNGFHFTEISKCVCTELGESVQSRRPTVLGTSWSVILLFVAVLFCYSLYRIVSTEVVICSLLVGLCIAMLIINHGPDKHPQEWQTWCDGPNYYCSTVETMDIKISTQRWCHFSHYY